MVEQEPVFSVVAVSRNDNHGGDMLGRMQHFVNGFISQCNRHKVPAELIMVEWNPPVDRPPLAQALSWPEDLGLADVRIVTVPRELHSKLDHSDALPLYQMIGKNVGIRRARAPFVLATNVDILFNDALFTYMRDELEHGTVLRVDRFDVPPDVPHGVSFDEVLSFCEKSYYSVGTRLGMYDVKAERILGLGETFIGLYLSARYRNSLDSTNSPGAQKSRHRSFSETCRLYSTALLRPVVRSLSRVKRAWPPQKVFAYLRDLPGRVSTRLVRKLRRAELVKMHTFACGDFTLLAREDWFRLHGYAEWPMYSWHIDSVFMHAARAVGIKQIVLDPSYRIYHVEQTAGSGWSPQAAEKLFNRLDAAGIPYLSDEKLKDLASEFLKDSRSTIINDENWGFADYELPTTRITADGKQMQEKAVVSG